ncbi:hypothetical protein [Anaerococcus cruorum]|uniref:ABC transporter permease n=1 Tax=Anaerococcus cruorum TaxID=3115617 RepID=A0ABW9MV94_9FIRM
MDYYKKYRIIENTRLASDINYIIHFFHKLPLLGKYTGDKYKGYGFKKFVFALGPIFSIIGQIFKSIFSFFIALVWTGAFLWLVQMTWKFPENMFTEFFELGRSNLAFLSFYLSISMLANDVVGNKAEIHKLNRQYRMLAKESGLIHAVFNPLRIGVGRAVAFTIFFGSKNSFLISLSLAFVRIISNAITLKFSQNKEKIYADKWWVNLGLFIILFAILMRFKSFDTNVLLIFFVLSLSISIFAIKYLLNFDDYGKLLEVARTEDLDRNLDFEQIANDSLALKDSDVDTSAAKNAHGYNLLNKLFFARHKRLLIKPIYKKDGILFALVLVALLTVKFVYKDFDSNFGVNNIIIYTLPIFASILFNNSNVNRAFFLNCDRPLLQYSFYKEKEAVSTMYKLRYKSLLKINIFGLLVGLIYLGLAYLLFESFDLKMLAVGGIFIFVTYLFYVAYNIAIYYLFQPFNHEAAMVGYIYQFWVSLLGYLNIFIPLIMAKVDKDPLFILEIISIILFVLVIIFHILVKVLGKNTFKIKK